MTKPSVAPKAAAAKISEPLTDEQLEALCLNVDGRQRIVDALVPRLQLLHPDFGRRPMTYDDALQALEAAELRIELGARGHEHADGSVGTWGDNRVLTVKAGLLEPYLTHVLFFLLAYRLGAPTEPLIKTHEEWLDPILRDLHAERELECLHKTFDEHQPMTLVARHAVRRRGDVVGWGTRTLQLRRYVPGPGPEKEKATRWTDEDVLRTVRAAVYAALVEHGVSRVGAERIGRHYLRLKEFAAALARFNSVVGRGAAELQRRGHRDLVKACAYAHAVKTKVAR